MHIEGPLANAVPEAVRSRPTRQSALFKRYQNVCKAEHRLPLEGTQLQSRRTWPGPPKERRGRVHSSLDCTRKSGSRPHGERCLEQCEIIKVEVSELGISCLDQKMQLSASRLYAANARNEGGCSKFVLLDAPRGNGAGRGPEVADAARFAEDPSQETAMVCDHAQLLLAFDAVCAWTLRDGVVVKRMTTYLARERQNVVVEMEELGKCLLSPIDIDDIIGVFA